MFFDAKWRLLKAPIGFSIDQNTGTMQWIPTEDGKFEVIIAADIDVHYDSSTGLLFHFYRFDHQKFFINVNSINNVNVINSKNLSYNLFQNYPNPFNPTTKIKYSIPTKDYIVIKLFDILGNEVITLVNEEKFAGNYEINFNGGNLSSGVYFYRMQAGSFISTKKFVLLK